MAHDRISTLPQDQTLILDAGRIADRMFDSLLTLQVVQQAGMEAPADDPPFDVYRHIALMLEPVMTLQKLALDLQDAATAALLRQTGAEVPTGRDGTTSAPGRAPAPS